MESEEFITLGGDNEHARTALDDRNGNEANSVGTEAVKTSDLLDDEAEPHEGSIKDLDADEPSLFTESVIVSDDVKNVNLEKTAENRDHTIKGVKRPRVTSDEQPPSVRVIFNSLTSQSKKKLEQLLQQWSEWDAKHCSAQGANKAIESGETTYYTALRVGVDKPSTVSFWMDNQTSKNREGNPMNDEFVPVYDRGYSLALTSGDGHSHLSGGAQLVDDSRCFNCGSYNHSLRECRKPRNHAAMKNARKKHNSKRNQDPNSRTPARYYQNTPPGKYDGLRPGVLEPETRKLLGLREPDPPPWLGRMQELGYPPGYMEDDAEKPSGLIIFGEEEIKEEENEDGQIKDMELSPPPELPTLPKKMSVDFPGINAPIPDNADKQRWAAACSSANSLAYRSSQGFNYPSESASRDQFHESRWSRNSWDDGPPGVDTSAYSYSSRHASYNPTDSFQSPRRDSHFSRTTSFQSSRRDSHRSRSSSFERSEKDRSSRHHENASRSSHLASDDHIRDPAKRDRYTESSSRHGHSEERDKRYKRS